ncbi:hypothetical protein EDF48_102149 [Curtobacterium sp. PhB191]|uniref:helix-turn-helix domain-containing protein n=1 Tax=Curtobacterium sp. PhB191 TaxID=2485202 RepID=UPI00104A0A83|nr:helix-turn-helix transcriptional regulator [Curtobacterium sp. PhB191]TCU86488.1 hypothetical protein EDF48_102149 [Curtobacterium sp. PhB191]
MIPEKHRTMRMYIAVRMKVALDEAGYTVVEAAPHIGCSSVSLYRKLRGERPLKLDELDRVAKLTGRDFSFFLPSGPA